MHDNSEKDSTSSPYLNLGAMSLAAISVYTPPLEGHTESLYSLSYECHSTHASTKMTESTVTREEIDAKIAVSTAELQGSVNTTNALTLGINTRLGTVETDLRELISKVDSNFIITWSGIIVSVLGLARLMAAGFGWIPASTPPR